MLEFSSILKGKALQQGDTMFTRVDGKATNAPIHEELLSGKEDSYVLDYLISKDAPEDILRLFRSSTAP